ncbi:class I SAM-dependent methyltransferase [uncultured Thiodictyon sp.]|uniref:class I SAM-dependent methyltransferase n=1 Tax=uncultured Thiodictyon sp. TaxID=1846217 RepID=UPI0025DEFF73|nr:class I SAM-dependent methyltransferase [uncultured Thiodictyon sp.]
MQIQDLTSPAAHTADRYRLYERAVQNPRAEVDFIDHTYRELRGRSARWLREDFCGTAAVCCEWVRRRPTNRAVGVDRDPEVLDWAQRNHLATLTSDQRTRIQLLEQDVATPASRPLDLVLALNFSYWLLAGRAALRAYFEQVRAALAPDGVLLLDAYGGYDAYRRIIEERTVEDPELGTFGYEWEQALYDPVSGRLVCHIHFNFPDGSRLERAFSYDWRLWSLPEIRELLTEAGFSRVQVYWQGWDAQGLPDGRFVPVEAAAPDAGWIAYLSAEP